MNKKKQMDVIRKRNAELNKELDDLKIELAMNTQLNMESYEQAKDLIACLEQIKADWLKSLEEIQNARVEYSFLIDELKNIKKIMTGMGFKIPFHKKILFKITRAFGGHDDND